MSKQVGDIKLVGTFGDLVLYNSKNGLLARKKAILSKNRFASDKFIRVRENLAEFTRAGKASKLIRSAFVSDVKQIGDFQSTARLTKLCTTIVKSDPESRRGERSMSKGKLSLLNGFEFNKDSPLTTRFSAPYTILTDTTAGTATLSVPVFTPKDRMSIPQGATHFQLGIAVSAIDFDNEVYQHGSIQSNAISIDAATEALSLVANYTALQNVPVITTLSLVFFEQVNSVNYTLNNGSYNALAIAGMGGIGATA